MAKSAPRVHAFVLGISPEDHTALIFWQRMLLLVPVVQIYSPPEQMLLVQAPVAVVREFDAGEEPARKKSIRDGQPFSIFDGNEEPETVGGKNTSWW